MNTETRNQLSDLIKSARLEKGLTLREVEAKGGYQSGMIGRLENRKFDFTIEALVQICRGLDLTLKDVLVCLDIPTFIAEEDKERVVTYDTLRSFLANSRLEKGLSLRKFAQQFNTNVNTVQRYEKKQRSIYSFTHFVELDRALSLNGKLVVMAWQAGENSLQTRTMNKQSRHWEPA